MAMSLVLRAACRKPAVAGPMMLQISRLGSTQAARQFPVAALLKSTQMIAPSMRPICTTLARKATAAAAGGHAGPGHHAKLWTVERALSAALLFALPATIAFPSQPLDLIVAVSTVMHAHWGLEACVVDYVRPVLVGNVVPKVAHVALLAFSAATLAGLVYFVQNDVGIGQAVRNIWAIKHKPAGAEAEAAGKKK